MNEMRSCFLCHEKICDAERNVATYDCGHSVHLHCAFQRASFHHTRCLQCAPDGDVTPDLGQDRQVSLAASTSLAVRRRQLHPPASMGFWKRLWIDLLADFSVWHPIPRASAVAGYQLGGAVENLFWSGQAFGARFKLNVGFKS